MNENNQLKYFFFFLSDNSYSADRKHLRERGDCATIFSDVVAVDGSGRYGTALKLFLKIIRTVNDNKLKVL